MRNKVLFIIVIVLCVTSSFMGIFSYSISIKNNTVVSASNNKDISIQNQSDFNALNSTTIFDVSDFSESKINTIDINSKVYTNDLITILDSDFKISSELETKIYENINSYGASSSFYIVSLEDGMSIGYNVDKKYQTASSIKAPFALSIQREIAKGNIDGNMLLTYESRHHSIGSGVVKNSQFVTQFTVNELIKHSLHESDNVAHIMLHSYLGVKIHNQHMANLGAGVLSLSPSSPWGYITPRSSALVWQDIYNFAIEDPEGIKFFNILANGKYNYFKEVMPGIPSAAKAGFSNYDVVETGIVLDSKPYIAIIIANKGGNRGAYTQVLQLISYINDIMNEYKTYCGV